MLNRTNRTLSANTNRLNLGTRTLANLANGNDGSMTLRTAVEFGVVSLPEMMPKSMKPGAIPIPGSSPEPSQSQRGCEARDQQGQPTVLALPPATPAVDPRGEDDRLQRGDAPRTLDATRLPSISLGWRRRRSGRAARAARVVLVPVAAP